MKYNIIKVNSNSGVLDFSVKNVSHNSVDFKYLSIINKVNKLRVNSKIKSNYIYYKESNKMTIDDISNIKKQLSSMVDNYSNSFNKIINKKIEGSTINDYIKFLDKKIQFKLMTLFKKEDSLEIIPKDIIQDKYMNNHTYYAISNDFIKADTNNITINNEVREYKVAIINDKPFLKNENKYTILDDTFFYLASNGYRVFESKVDLDNYIGSRLLLLKLQIHKSQQNFKKIDRKLDKMIDSIELDSVSL